MFVWLFSLGFFKQLQNNYKTENNRWIRSFFEKKCLPIVWLNLFKGARGNFRFTDTDLLLHRVNFRTINTLSIKLVASIHRNFDSWFINCKTIGWNIFRILTNVNVINICFPYLPLMGIHIRLTFDFKVTLKSNRVREKQKFMIMFEVLCSILFLKLSLQLNRFTCKQNPRSNYKIYLLIYYV